MACDFPSAAAEDEPAHSAPTEHERAGAPLHAQSLFIALLGLKARQGCEPHVLKKGVSGSLPRRGRAAVAKQAPNADATASLARNTLDAVELQQTTFADVAKTGLARSKAMRPGLMNSRRCSMRSRSCSRSSSLSHRLEF